MPRQNYLRITVVACLGLIAAGVSSSADDEEKDQPGPQAANIRARRDAARKVYEGALQHHVQEPEHVPGDVSYFHDWSVRWLQAERDLGQTKAEKITALEGHFKRMQVWKKMLDAEIKEGQAPAYAASAAEFFRLEAEDWLVAARAVGK